MDSHFCLGLGNKQFETVEFGWTLDLGNSESGWSGLCEVQLRLSVCHAILCSGLNRIYGLSNKLVEKNAMKIGQSG